MERMNGLALWRQIERQIAEEIARGTYRPGDRLPTEAELAQRFGVNRHTLRRAVASLQEAGLVRIEQGRGTFIQEDVIDYQVGRRTRFSENIMSLDRRPGGKLLRSGEIRADADAARALGVRRDSPLIMIENLNEVDGRPVSVALHCFPRARFDGIVEAYRDTGSITKALFQLGVKDYFRQLTRVMPRMPGAEDARLLQQARSQPILVTESVNVDPEGRPIEYAIARYAGQRVQLVFEP